MIITKLNTAGRLLLVASSLVFAPSLLQAQTVGHNFPLYVVQNTLPSGASSIVKVDSAGNSTPFVAVDGLILAMATDSSGSLYATLLTPDAPGEVIKLDPNGTQTVVAIGGFYSGLAIDAGGDLWVMKWNGSISGDIVRIDPSGNESTVLSDSSIVYGALAFDAAGNLYYTSPGINDDGHQIMKVVPNGSPTIFASISKGNISFSLAFDAIGNLYDVSWDNVLQQFHIVKIAPSGSQSNFESNPLPSFTYVFSGLAFDAAGNLYLSGADFSEPHGTITKLDPSGTPSPFAALPASQYPGAMAFSRSAANYTFSGFLAPIVNVPDVNIGRAGRAYSVKWQLKDATGAYVKTLSAVSSINYKAASCNGFTWGANAADLPAATTGNSSLRYDTTTNQFVYNWATPNTTGCYVLTVSFDDGQSFSANFNLK